MIKNVLVLESFNGGSHKQMTDLFKIEFDQTIDFYDLSAKKWHWRSIASALHFSQIIPLQNSYTKLFCSSVVNLTELIGLRPDLARLEKIIYFHENQLDYPVLEKKNRDFHFGYSQILSCLTADRVLFNSSYNMKSFLNHINPFLKPIPSDSRPKNISDEIRSKSQVLYYPMVYPETAPDISKDSDILHVVWNHRWEHDKNPELFFRTLIRLKEEGFRFRLSVLGETYDEKPEIFQEAQQKLSSEILNWGFSKSKSDYYSILQTAHVVVSTAQHEYFGISMLEATYCGCFPICPDNLSYPEIYPSECLYSTDRQLHKMLRNFCKHPNLAIAKREKLEINFDEFSWKTLKNCYASFLT